MFGIMRIEKRGRAAVTGLQLENNRTPEDGRHFAASDIDRTQTKENFYLAYCKDWSQEITHQIADAGCKERKDSVVALDALYTASPEWFEKHSQEDALRFFSDCYEFHCHTYGKPLNAVVHFDEQTPHMHVISVPIVRDEKGAHLSAKRLMGGRDDYRKRQDAFFEQVSHKWDLDRGELSSPEKKRKHLDVQDYKLQQNAKAIEAQKQKQAALTAHIDTQTKEAAERLQEAQEAEKRVKAATTQLSDLESRKKALTALEVQETDERVKRLPLGRVMMSREEYDALSRTARAAEQAQAEAAAIKAKEAAILAAAEQQKQQITGQAVQERDEAVAELKKLRQEKKQLIQDCRDWIDITEGNADYFRDSVRRDPKGNLFATKVQGLLDYRLHDSFNAPAGRLLQEVNKAVDHAISQIPLDSLPTTLRELQKAQKQIDVYKKVHDLSDDLEL